MLTLRELVIALFLAVAFSLTGCAEVYSFSASAIEQRRVMNDMQARGTMAAVCDIAIGSYFRILTDTERRLSARRPELGGSLA